MGLILVAALTPMAVAQRVNSIKPSLTDIENVGKRDINKGSINFTSLPAEAAMGSQAAAQLELNVTLVNDASIVDYVNRIAQNIARNSDSSFPITIKLIRSDDPNPIALPGGLIYVTTGTIRSVNNEAELAWNIAQMVGHVAARHTTENNSKATMLQIATIPAIANGTVLNPAALQQATPIGIPISVFRFSQDAQREADFLGLQYLYKAGYDPQAAITNLKNVEAAEGPAVQSPLFSPVIPAAIRIKTTTENISSFLPARATSVLNTPEFDSIKKQTTQSAK